MREHCLKLKGKHLHTGGSGLGGVDGVVITEQMAYGCSGITTASLSNDLGVS